jgi:hypothetical protein
VAISNAFHRLLDVIQRPYDDQPDAAEYAQAASACRARAQDLLRDLNANWRLGLWLLIIAAIAPLDSATADAAKPGSFRFGVDFTFERMVATRSVADDGGRRRDQARGVRLPAGQERPAPGGAAEPRLAGRLEPAAEGKHPPQPDRAAVLHRARLHRRRAIPARSR